MLNLLSTIAAPFRRSEARAAVPDHRLPPWLEAGSQSLISLGFKGELKSIDEDTALTATGVWACVQAIAGAIGTLPIHVRDADTKQILPGHPLARLFREPNGWMGRSDLMEALLVNLLTAGNGCLYVDRDASFRPVGLYPLRYCDVSTRMQGGRLHYLAQAGTRTTVLEPERIVHVRGMSRNGIDGLSPLTCGARSIGLALALDQFAEMFFVNGANVGSVIELPPMKTPEQLEAFKKMWVEQYQGVQNAHKMAAAPGLKVHRSGFSPKESQADEQRLTQLREIARIYQVPPHVIGDLEKTTVGNSEEQAKQFAQQTLRRWTVKIEEAFERTLLREDEKGRIRIRINLDAMIRASATERVAMLSQAVGGAPIMKVNEAREMLDLQPADGGDVLQSPLNQSNAANDQRDALLAGVARRYAAAEAKALRAAAKRHDDDPDELRVWARTWYAAQESRIAEALEGSGADMGRVIAWRDQRQGAIERDASPEGVRSMAQAAEAVLAAVLATPKAPEIHERDEPRQAA